MMELPDIPDTTIPADLWNVVLGEIKEMEYVSIWTTKCNKRLTVNDYKGSFRICDSLGVKYCVNFSIHTIMKVADVYFPHSIVQPII